MAFEDLQGGRLHSLSGQCLRVPGHPHRKAVFADVRREPRTFQHMPIVLSLGTTVKSLAPPSLPVPPGIYIH